MFKDSFRLKLLTTLLLFVSTLTIAFMHTSFKGHSELNNMDEINITKAKAKLDHEIKTLLADAKTLESKLKTENVLYAEATADNKKLKEKEELHAIYKGTRWLAHFNEKYTTKYS